MMKKSRGRGFTSEAREAMRRPGHQLPTNLEPPKFATLINLINNLDINKVPSEASVDDILNEIDLAKKDSTLNDVFCNLHKQALQDRRFGVKLAIAVSNIKINSTNDRSFRNILLSSLQNDYERYIYTEPEDFKKKNAIEFRNVVSFMGEISNRLKIGNQPIKVLNKPLLRYLQLLLDDSEEEDIEVVTSQISMNGSIIHESLPDELEDFITRVKKVLINRNLSAKSRAMLLLIVDMANHQYAILPTKLQEFYSIQLSLNNFMSVYRHEHLPMNNVKETNDTNDLNVSSAQNSNFFVPVTDNNTLFYPQNSDNLDNSASLRKMPAYNNENKHQSVPRAIRGAGSSATAVQPLSSSPPPNYGEQQLDKSKDRNSQKKSPKGKKDNNGTESWQANKPKGHNKGWGHDDRFEKDYS